MSVQAGTLGALFSDPAFLCVFIALLLTVANVVIGVSILPKDRRKKGYRLHRYAYYAVLTPLCGYLIANHFLHENSGFDYVLGGYFVTVVPWSRKINVTLHAVIASVGLVLLTTAAFLRIA